MGSKSRRRSIAMFILTVQFTENCSSDSVSVNKIFTRSINKLMISFNNYHYILLNMKNSKVLVTIIIVSSVNYDTLQEYSLFILTAH